MNIKDIMSSNLITCDKDATLNDVSIKMKNYDIGFIPISDEKKIIYYGYRWNSGAGESAD